MKLTKDHLIEGQIFKAGTEVKIKENSTDLESEFLTFLWKEIPRRKPKIQGQELEIDRHSGSISIVFLKEDFCIYCNPFWEGEKGIGIAYSSFDDGDYVDMNTLPFNLSGDFESDYKNYLQTLNSNIPKIISEIRRYYL